MSSGSWAAFVVSAAHAASPGPPLPPLPPRPPPPLLAPPFSEPCPGPPPPLDVPLLSSGGMKALPFAFPEHAATRATQATPRERHAATGMALRRRLTVHLHGVASASQAGCHAAADGAGRARAIG